MQQSSTDIQKLKKVIQQLSVALQQQKKQNEDLVKEKEVLSKDDYIEANNKNEREIELQALRDKLQEQQFTNTRLTQQVQYLQQTVSETKSKSQGGLLNSIWTGGSQSQELQKTLRILQEELEGKIQENENIHISNYEERKQMEEQVKQTQRDKIRLQHQCEGAEGNLKQKEEEVNVIGEQLQEMKTVNGDLQGKVGQMEQQMFASQSRLKEEEKVLRDKAEVAQQIVISNIPYLQDTNHDDQLYTVQIHNYLVKDIDVNQFELQNSYKQFVSNFEAKTQVISMNQNSSQSQIQQTLQKNSKSLLTQITQMIEAFIQFQTFILQPIDYKNISVELQNMIVSFQLFIKQFDLFQIQFLDFLDKQDLYLVKNDFIENDCQQQTSIMNQLQIQLQIIQEQSQTIIQYFINKINPYSKFTQIKLKIQNSIELILDLMKQFMNINIQKLEKENVYLNNSDESKDQTIENQNQFDVTYKQTLKMKITIKNYNNNIAQFLKKFLDFIDELNQKQIIVQNIINYLDEIYKIQCCQKYKHEQFLKSLANKFDNDFQGLHYQEVLQLKKDFELIKQENEFQKKQLDSYKIALEQSEQQLKKFDQCSLQNQIDNDYGEQNKENLSQNKNEFEFNSEYKMRIKICENTKYSGIQNEQSNTIFNTQLQQLQTIMKKNELLQSQKAQFNDKIELIRAEKQEIEDKYQQSNDQITELKSEVEKQKENQKSLQENYEQQIIMLSENLASMQN